jgi:hypothetical protein
MKKSLLFAALFAIAAPAAATLQLSANINGQLFNCVDNNAACDTNPLTGQLQIANTTFNGVEIQGSSQFQIIGPSDIINTASFQIINDNTTAATVQVAISGTDFIGPVNHYAASGSGTWQNADGSSLTLSYYGSAANTQGATNPTDLPGVQLATFSDMAVGPADAFGFSNAGAFNAGSLFGMSLGTAGTLAGWNGVAGAQSTLVGRSQTLLATQVPEPATLALLAIGLLGCGLYSRKK